MSKPLSLHPVIMEDLQQILAADIHWEKLQNKTVLITGANGMIASYLIYSLLYANDIKNANITVLALVRSEQNARARFGDILQRTDIELIVQDVCEPVCYKSKIDYVIHAASQASPYHFTADPVGTIRANTVGTENMLSLATQHKADGFLYLSTREIYGQPISDKLFISEDDYGIMNPVLVRSCYPESKRLAETLCASYRHQYGLDAKIARIAHTYGPGMQISDGRVVGDFLGDVVAGRDIVMKSAGLVELALTYISDIIIGLFMLLLNFESWCVNISTEENPILVKDLAELLVTTFSSKHIKVDLQLPKDAAAQQGYLAHKVALLSIARAKKEGYLPKMDLIDGLKRTVAYFESESEGK